MGLVWSVPLSFKGNDRQSPKRGGKRIVGGGSKNVFGEGFFRRIYGMFSTPLGRSLKNGPSILGESADSLLFETFRSQRRVTSKAHLWRFKEIGTPTPSYPIDFCVFHWDDLLS